MIQNQVIGTTSNGKECVYVEFNVMPNNYDMQHYETIENPFSKHGGTIKCSGLLPIFNPGPFNDEYVAVCNNTICYLQNSGDYNKNNEVIEWGTLEISDDGAYLTFRLNSDLYLGFMSDYKTARLTLVQEF